MADGQGRSSEQGVKLLYIRDYLRKYTDIDHPKNANDIVQYLASQGIKASRKTIYNDILRLQIDFHEPIDYNPKKWGYYITQPQFENKDLRMLIDCVQLSSFLTAEESYALVEKILGLGTVYCKDNIEKHVRKRTDVNKPESSVFSNVEIITKAISLRKKIRYRFLYPTLEREQQNTPSDDIYYIVSPKHIRNINGHYHLTAYPDDRAPYDYSISIDRMADIKILSLDIEPSAEKELGEVYQRPLIEREHYTFDPNREYAVTILFCKADMKKVKSHFGNDVPLIPYDEDTMMITVHTPINYTLFSNVLSFGAQAKILSPREAIGEFFEYNKRRIASLEELYGYGTPEFLKDVPTNYDDLRAQQHRFKHTRRVRKPKR